ncbi:MAG TPA: hypothetical protein VFW98_07220, partial [Gemmatimonadaceae bacterium]|nr:hypothetical protein [Gemmatimonadaceae bacterium]
DVERMYIGILKRYDWPNPYLSSASGKSTQVTGANGVKMTGPYDWVPPSYWLADTAHGGAFGFNTETSPGAAVPPIESMRRMLPAADIWPIDSVWAYHAAGGQFKHSHRFEQALAARYGKPTSAADYTFKAQLMTYEGERAMFEAYRRNAYISTGLIQWMLTNAWPSTFWHLVDYYLRPGGGYFGAKKALEPVHVQYSYDDRSIVVVNGTHARVPGLRVQARVLSADATEKFSRDMSIDLPADTTVRLFTIPGAAELKLPADPATYFVALRLQDAHGRTVSRNLYWLSTHPDLLDRDSTTWYVTPVQQYADYTALRTLPKARVQTSAHFARHGAWEDATVTLSNPGRSIAFFMRLQLTRGAGGEEVLPVLWEDNYVTLLPGETRAISARVRVKDLRGAKPAVHVEGWNVEGTEASVR